MRKHLFFLIALISVCLSVSAQKEDRLDYSFGFREFKLKTQKETYAGYEMKRTDLYGLPEIVQVYELPYEMGIGNTKMQKLHLFFLGNKLVRVTALLNDSLSLGYLKKSFGEGEPPTVTVKLDHKLKQDIAEGKEKFAYEPIWSWQAEQVRFEEKWLYLCDKGACVKYMTLDLYLIDFQDLMNSMLLK